MYAKVCKGPASEPIAPARLVGKITINDANLCHKHFYLADLIDGFPADVVGGANRSKEARNTVLLDWGGLEPERTDIDGKKKIFRKRRWVGLFYELNRASAGDRVLIHEIGPYHYRISHEKYGYGTQL